MPWSDPQPDLMLSKIRKIFVRVLLGLSFFSMVLCGLAAIYAPNLIGWIMASMFLSGIGVDIFIHAAYICRDSHLPTGEDLYGSADSVGRGSQEAN